MGDRSRKGYENGFVCYVSTGTFYLVCVCVLETRILFFVHARTTTNKTKRNYKDLHCHIIWGTGIVFIRLRGLFPEQAERAPKVSVGLALTNAVFCMSIRQERTSNTLLSENQQSEFYS